MTVLWRVCQLLLAHARSQVDERDDAFVAVERRRCGNGWFDICRHGLEKIVYSLPSRLKEVDVKCLGEHIFNSAVWRAGDAARDAGAMAEGGGGGGGGLMGAGVAARFGCV